MGSRRPIAIDSEALSKTMPFFDQHKIGQDPYFMTEKDFLLLYAGDAQPLLPLVGDGPLNTDDRPIIEYLAPISHIQKRQVVGSDLADLFDRLSDTESGLGDFAKAGAFFYRATLAVDRMEYDAGRIICKRQAPWCVAAGC